MYDSQTDIKGEQQWLNHYMHGKHTNIQIQTFKHSKYLLQILLSFFSFIYNLVFHCICKNNIYINHYTITIPCDFTTFKKSI